MVYITYSQKTEMIHKHLQCKIIYQRKQLDNWNNYGMVFEIIIIIFQRYL